MTHLASQADGGNAAAPVGPPDAGTPPWPAPGAQPVIVDVWSRTAPKYRIRAAVLLSLTFVLYAALCVFTHWLHVARLFDFSWDSYFSPFRFWGGTTQNLTDFLRYPISVEVQPVQGVVLGLLVAAIVAVPILVAILYRLACAIPFALSVFFFAHLPWLSATLIIGCALAAARPLRLKFRYGSALLGMVPVVLYLYLATQPSGGDAGVAAAPEQRSLLLAPWVLALLAACAMTGVVLLIAKIVNYRPGAIAPVMAVTFAMPALLFFRYVGRDELYYRVAEAEFGPRSARFAPTHALGTLREFIDRADTPGFEPTEEMREIWTGRVGTLHERVLARMWRDFLADRAVAFDGLARFIADNPNSRYVRCALYMQARALDTRIDERAVRESGRRELYADFPHVQSESAWTALLTQFRESPLAVAARVRLAQLALRRGDVTASAALLARVLARTDGAAAKANDPGVRSLGPLGPPDPESSLSFDAAPLRFEARRLSDCIEANRDDPKYGNQPLQAWAQLDPRRSGYSDELLALAHEFPDAHMADNLAVEWADSLRDGERRRDALQACVARFGAGDALPQALFRLAELEIQSSPGDPVAAQSGRDRLREVVARFGATCWGQAAAERLKMIEPAVAKVTE